MTRFLTTNHIACTLASCEQGSLQGISLLYRCRPFRGPHPGSCYCSFLFSVRAATAQKQVLWSLRGRYAIPAKVRHLLHSQQRLGTLRIPGFGSLCHDACASKPIIICFGDGMALVEVQLDGKGSLGIRLLRQRDRCMICRGLQESVSVPHQLPSLTCHTHDPTGALVCLSAIRRRILRTYQPYLKNSVGKIAIMDVAAHTNIGGACRPGRVSWLG